MLFVNKFKLGNMRKVEDRDNWMLPESRKTDFTREELLDILDFYLQYKPMLDEYVSNREHYPQFDPHDFTILLYMYGILDIDYIDNWENLLKKYGKTNVEEVSKEKLDFLEIITVFTTIHRVNRNDFDDETYDYCIEKNVYYNLLCRLEEIKNELEK